MSVKSEKRKGKKVLLLIAAVLAALCGTGVGTFAAFIHESPQIALLDDWRPTVNTTILAVDGSVLAEFALEKRTLVRLSDTPLNLQHAFLATEDSRFYEHWGIDVKATARAMVANIKARSIRQGGSTITQQLARNLPIGIDKRRKLSRKLKEAFVALQIERKFTKEEILELYLNQIYLGEGAYGVESGARAYFGKHVDELTVAECAMLAALPKSPRDYSPRKNPEKALRRRDTVLKLMLRKRYISRRAYDAAREEPVELRQFETEEPFAEYFVEHVRQQLEETQGYDRLYQGGLTVETTLDQAMQRAAERAVKKGLAVYEAGRSTPVEGTAESDEAEERVAQAALIAIEPSTGHIKAMVGGRDFSKYKFNRAVQAQRQPGSAFKPFVFAVAFEKGFTASDTFLDFPFEYPYRDPRTGERVAWAPKNFEEKYFGESTLRQALVRSQNVVAAQLLKDVGLGPVIRLAHKAGISSYIDRNLSIALGTAVVTPLELASGYATFANKGIYCRPLSILRVKDPDGNVLDENATTKTQAMRADTAYLVTHLLRGVIEDGFQATGIRARGFTRGVADDPTAKIIRAAGGKTGTTEDCKDAWFAGFTPDLATIVWVGYDDNTTLGKTKTGGRVACPIWTQFMSEALGDKPVKKFDKPDNVVHVKVDWHTGKPVEPDRKAEYPVIDEAFLSGREPKTASSS
jgi:penicillin-binding protein 1A